MRLPTEESKEEEKLRIDKEQSEYYQKVFERFDGHCVVCYPQDPPYPMGVTVHELHSKAQYPKDWWKDINNGILLCQNCHDRVHTMNSKDAESLCRIHMEKYLRSTS